MRIFNQKSKLGGPRSILFAQRAYATFERDIEIYIENMQKSYYGTATPFSKCAFGAISLFFKLYIFLQTPKTRVGNQNWLYLGRYWELGGTEIYRSQTRARERLGPVWGRSETSRCPNSKMDPILVSDPSALPCRARLVLVRDLLLLDSNPQGGRREAPDVANVI